MSKAGSNVSDVCQSLAGCNSTNSSLFLSVTVSRSNFPIITNDTHTQSTFICMHDVSVCIFGTKTAFFAIKKNPHPGFSGSVLLM